MFRFICVIFLLISVYQHNTSVVSHTEEDDSWFHQDLAHRAMPVQQKEMDCGVCSLITTQLVKVLDTEKGREDMRGIMYGFCGVLFAENPEDGEVCKSVANVLISLSPIFVKQITEWSWTGETVCSFLFNTCQFDCCVSDAPEQIKINYGPTETSMYVNWISRVNAPGIVLYGNIDEKEDMRVGAVRTKNSAFGWTGFGYHSKLDNLKPNTTYTYTIQHAGHSRTYSFRTLPVDIGTDKRPLKVAQIADVDSKDDGLSVRRLIKQLANAGKIDVVLFVGDQGYSDGYERFNDDFGRDMQELTATMPTMTVPGNHELLDFFKIYKHRYMMPGTCVWPEVKPGDNFLMDVEECSNYYTFTQGPVKFVMAATESVMNGYECDEKQHQFLDRSLQKGHKWTIMTNHRPFYCTQDNENCNAIPSTMRAEVEPKLVGTVDVMLTGHIHSYERSHPSIDGEVVAYPNSTKPIYIDDNTTGVQHTYAKPKAMVHITQSGGNREGQRKANGDKPYSAFVSVEPGVMILTIEDKTLTGEFLSASRNGTLLDGFVILK